MFIETSLFTLQRSRGAQPVWSLRFAPPELSLVCDRCSYKHSAPTELNAPSRASNTVQISMAPGHRGFSKGISPLVFTAFALLLLAVCAQAQVRITIDHNDNKTANAEYKFQRVPSPARNDAGSKAILTLVDAQADGTAADIGVLIDGLVPDAEDQPRKNFF